MALFRSKQMGFFNLIASHEHAHDILNQLGETNSLQFLDLNAHEASFNRPFSNYIKRCEEMENKLHTIEGYMQTFNQPIIPCEDPQEFLQHLRRTLSNRNKSEKTYIYEIEAEIDNQMSSLVNQIKSYENIVENYNHLVEYREVLLKTRSFIGENAKGEGSHSKVDAILGRDIQFNNLAGVINKEDSLRFRRLLFRITRGMTWISLIDIEKPQEPVYGGNGYFLDSVKPDTKEKTVFLIVYQGGQYEMLKGKLSKLCDSFGASKYGVPEDPSTFTRKLDEVDNQLKDAREIARITKGHIETILYRFSDTKSDYHSYSYIEDLKLFVAKEKALYHNLNMLKHQNTLLRGSCWCPLDRVQAIHEALLELNKRNQGIGSCEFYEVQVPPGINPPTHFETNSFTGVFQEIVNTYGIPRYREINPGLFTIATFPFLFGVMFGDIGHGALLLAAGLYLIYNNEKISKQREGKLRTLLPARYLLALQGFFAFYCGLIYNDLMSVPLNLFGSCYHDASSSPGTCTYPLGIDPGWYGAQNELTFLNSFKMKLSIVLGVSHMIFGILLRGLNNIFARKWLDFLFEFVPMLVFMTVTFGYMVFLIFVKWATPWLTPQDISAAPSIINIFIQMALSPGRWDTNIGQPLYGDSEGVLQAKVQLFFLLAALICALLILIPKPLILWWMHKSQPTRTRTDSNESSPQISMRTLLDHSVVSDTEILVQQQQIQKDFMQKSEYGEHLNAEGHFDMGEVFVHQIIEAIEFVLGSISNTASYLRLWALSLAHSQLSKVFFANSLGSAISSGNVFTAFFTFWIFANVTLGVLLLMDQMECFLHALRLHWVEFQNKFYKADGYAFAPFSFENTLRSQQK